MKHRKTLAAAALPACLGLVLAAATPTYAGGAAGSTSGTKTTTFAFRASGFGTRLIGGQVPADSATSGYQLIGCTAQAGRSRTNDEAEVTLPGLGTAYGVRTHVWTTARHGVVASHSTHSIASLVLAQSGFGSLSITGITSNATAYHDATGFHATTSTEVGGLTFTPPVGTPQTFPAPTPDQPLSLPGLGTIYAGKHVTSHSGTGSVADAYTLRIDSDGSGSSVQLAHSRAQLDGGLVSGVFGGRAAGTHVLTAAGGVLKSGPNPLTVMPCQGTYGKTKRHATEASNLGGQVVVSNVSSAVNGSQTAQSAQGTTQARVARLSLGGGQVLLNGIVAKAHVRRSADGVTKSSRGTQLGTLTVNGQEQTFPKTGVLEVPGVAKLERGLVTKSRAGIEVIGLRITLLDGSGAVIDLAEASLTIRPRR